VVINIVLESYQNHVRDRKMSLTFHQYVYRVSIVHVSVFDRYVSDMSELHRYLVSVVFSEQYNSSLITLDY